MTLRARDGWSMLALGLAALALRWPFTTRYLYHWDSVNFALSLERYDVRLHQPHPPGYPVYIAVAKVSTAVFHAAGAATPEVDGLAALSALGGAVTIVAAFFFFRRLATDDDAVALIGVLLLACSPLFWFTALRPLSDTTGLALALAAQACLAGAFVRRRQGHGADPETIAASGRMIVAGALIAGLAIGVRTQTLWLTLPLLALVLVDRTGRGAAGAILGSAMTFSIGVLVFGMFMLTIFFRRRLPIRLPFGPELTAEGRLRFPLRLIRMLFMLAFLRMLVLMLMPLGQVEPHADAHQYAGDDELQADRLAEHGHGDERAHERRGRVVGAGSRRSEVSERDDEEYQARAIAEQADHGRAQQRTGSREWRPER